MMAKGSEVEIEGPPRESAVEFLCSLAAGIVKLFFIITFVVHAFEIPSSSMENTLLVGDHVFVDRIRFAPKTGWTRPLVPYRDVLLGDIVVFLHPDPHDAGMFVVKRVMGVPGDRIHLRNGVVYRNGEALKESYAVHAEDSPADAYRDNFPAIAPSPERGVYPNWVATMASYVQGEDLVVPAGHFFAMGDNRDVSLDSRYWGFIPQENIIGRPMFIYWSFETPEDQYRKTDFGDRIGFLTHAALHFFDETRWRRTLRVVR
jgi:signal peptidase I